MKTRIIFLLVGIGLIGCTPDFTRFEKRTFTAQNGDIMPYRILLPEDYSANEKYPLVLFLHGAGERGNDNEKQLVHGTDIYLSSQNRKKYPCIVLVPQCPSDSYWSAVDIDRSTTPLTMSFNYKQKMTKAMSLVIELLISTINEEAVDQDRIYITGLSMGGMGTFEAVQRHPDFFAAAAPICGGGDPAAFDSSQTSIPFWIFHGSEDDVVNVEESRQMKAGLIANGNSVMYTEYPGVNHNSWDKAYAEPDFLPWLFSFRKKKG